MSIIKIAKVTFGHGVKEHVFLCDMSVKVGDVIKSSGVNRERTIVKIELIDDATLPKGTHFKPLSSLIFGEEEDSKRGLSLDDLLKKHSYAHLIEAKDLTLYGKDEALDLLMESNFKKRMRNNILIGPSGCGKTTLIKKLAYLMRDTYSYVELDQALTVSGTTLRGQHEERISTFLEDVYQYNLSNDKKIIVYIDEIHTCLYNNAKSSLSLGDIIKGYLSEEKITLIGATTVKEYSETIANDKALVRRFSPIYLEPMNEDSAKDLLVDFCEEAFSEDIIMDIIKESERINEYILDVDLAIEILDRMMARCIYKGISPTNEMMTSISKAIFKGRQLKC